MAFDFTTLPDRRNSGSSKWNAMLAIEPDALRDVVPLSVADMEFVTPKPIIDALQNLVSATSLGYTEPTDAFFEACISWQRRRHAWEPRKEWACLSPGVVPALHTAVNAFTDPGDAVIIQPPVFYPFSMAIEHTGRTIARNPLVLDDNGYSIDFEGLEQLAFDPRTKAIIFCSPHNPVGRVWTEDELKRVMGICCDAGLTILCDEIHNDIIMPGRTHTTMLSLVTPEQAEHIVVFTSWSKTFNLAGTQGSVIYIPNDELRERYQKAYTSQGMFSLNAFAYQAAIAAYNECEGWLDELLGVIEANYKLMVERLDGHLGGLKVMPLEGTYLPWVDFSSWNMTADERERFLQDEAHLYLDGGKMFGDEGAAFERFNIACPTWVLENALERLAAAYFRKHGQREGMVL